MENNNQCMPLIGDFAPEFVASSTNGKINFPTDYTGKWIVFFSHPSDFTPVCTTEFVAFQNNLAGFDKMNTVLVGLSVGALSSHLAWIDAIAHMPHGVNIEFPIIDDIGGEIARKYGMIHDSASDTHAVRAVFIIDTVGVIRAILYYPSVLGRNMQEIMRMLMGLQTADAFKVALPANWIPGDNVLIGAPQTVSEMRNHKGDQPWFLINKPLSQREIYEKICKENHKTEQ